MQGHKRVGKKEKCKGGVGEKKKEKRKKRQSTKPQTKPANCSVSVEKREEKETI
jgi:hypothetical protein